MSKSCFAKMRYLKLQMCILLLYQVHVVGGANLRCRVGLVEYRPYTESSSPTQNLEHNLNLTLDILDYFATKNVSVVVFPETHLFYKRSEDKLIYVTNVKLMRHPCTDRLNYPSYMVQLSCKARDYSMYITINVIEVEEENTYYSITLTFDTAGYILLAYRNDNQIGSPDLAQLPIPFVIPIQKTKTFFFTVNANQTFIFNPTSLFYGFRYSKEKFVPNDPSMKYHIIGSNWISELPFFTSSQVYHMWAFEYNMIIFVSSINDRDAGVGGSGVFNKKKGVWFWDVMNNSVKNYKTYIYEFLEDLDTSIENGSMDPGQEENFDKIARSYDGFGFLTDPNTEDYHTILMDTLNDTEMEVCHNGFCCQINISIENLRSYSFPKNVYTYHLMAYSGPKNYHSIFTPGGIRVCGVIACLDDRKSSCGKIFPKYDDVAWPILFRNLTISSKFGTTEKIGIYYNSQFPTSLLASMIPIKVHETDWQQTVFYQNESVSHQKRTFSIIKPQNRILTFAILERNFQIASASCFVCKSTLFYILLWWCSIKL